LLLYSVQKVSFLSRLATLAAIADTALESVDKNNEEMRNEFIVSWRERERI
jgi:hypothetical protein